MSGSPAASRNRPTDCGYEVGTLAPWNSLVPARVNPGLATHPGERQTFQSSRIDRRAPQLALTRRQSSPVARCQRAKRSDRLLEEGPVVDRGTWGRFIWGD
jgi:hypothetical protein